MNLEGIDKKLINLLQAELPLKSRPYFELGLKLGMGEDEVIRRIERSKMEGLIRQISPVFDARKLGYETTLVAMRVAETERDRAVQLIMEYPGVSHGYEREHHFNPWFTLAIPSGADVEDKLKRLSIPAGAEAVFALPALKVFKIGTYFPVDGDEEEGASILGLPGGALPKKVKLSQTDRLVTNELQQDLPLIPHPFAHIATRLNMDTEELLARCQSLKRRGVMRRFGAAVNHRKAGFAANAMTCWVVSPEMVTLVGKKLAALREVSHCYERKTTALWRYNLFAMIHGYTKEECHEIVSRVTSETGLQDYVILFSTREFKKTRVKYLV